MSIIPVQSVWACAKAIVNSVCRGDTYMVVPSWFRTTYWMRVQCPELLDFGTEFFIWQGLRSRPMKRRARKSWTTLELRIFCTRVLFNQLISRQISIRVPAVCPRNSNVGLVCFACLRTLCFKSSSRFYTFGKLV